VVCLVKRLQVASRALQVPVELIHISETSSQVVANSTATAASCGSDLSGGAVLVRTPYFLVVSFSPLNLRIYTGSIFTKYSSNGRFWSSLNRPSFFRLFMATNFRVKIDKIGRLTFIPKRVRSIVVSMSVYLAVCLLVLSHNSKSTRPTFTNFCACYLWPWRDLLTALPYVMYFRFCG